MNMFLELLLGVIKLKFLLVLNYFMILVILLDIVYYFLKNKCVFWCYGVFYRFFKC